MLHTSDVLEFLIDCLSLNHFDYFCVNSGKNIVIHREKAPTGVPVCCGPTGNRVLVTLVPLTLKDNKREILLKATNAMTLFEFIVVIPDINVYLLIHVLMLTIYKYLQYCYVNNTHIKKK